MNPFVHEKRGSMTAQRLARIFANAGGRCHVCKRKLRPGDDWEADHINALCNGGKDDDENLAPICEGCHWEKTKHDVSEHAHGRRAYTKHVVPKRFRRSKAWR